jgi:hypothetical protein
LPLRRHTRRLRPLPPGPSSRLRPGTATSRACSVPAVPPGFNGFLRRGRVRGPAPSTTRRFVAPCSRPWGSPRFRLPGRPFGLPRPEGREPRGPMESSPVAKTLRSFPLPGSLRPYRHRASPFRSRPRSPAGVPSRRSLRTRLRVATLRCVRGRPQGLVPPRSPLRPRSVSAAHRSMLPWALDRHVPMLPRVPAPPSHAGRCAPRVQPRVGVS